MRFAGAEVLTGARAAMARALMPPRVGPTVLATVEVPLARAAALAGGDDLLLHAMIVKATANALTRHRLYTWAYNGAYRVFPTDRIDLRAPAGPGVDAASTVVRDADRKTLAQVADDLRAGAAAPVLAAAGDPVATLLDAHPFLLPLRWDLDALHALRMFASRSYEERFWERHREAVGSFYLSNVGPLGIKDFAAPVRLPSIVELGVCAPFERTVVEKGALARRPFMHLVGRLDHRMTDVGQTARFLGDVRKNLEAPDTSLGPAT